MALFCGRKGGGDFHYFVKCGSPGFWMLSFAVFLIGDAVMYDFVESRSIPDHLLHLV